MQDGMEGVERQDIGPVVLRPLWLRKPVRCDYGGGREVGVESRLGHCWQRPLQDLVRDVQSAHVPACVVVMAVV